MGGDSDFRPYLLLVITDRINRSIIALLGAGIMIITGVLTQEEAVRGIDFNTIALLAGMMVLVSISRRCGMFEYLAMWSAKQGRAQPWAMLAMLSLVTAVVSAFLDNVTTVLLIAPVTLSVTRDLEMPPYPFLFAEVFASNIGGTATLIGDPPNIIIGSAANLSFNDFVINLTPVIVIVMAAQLLLTHLIWGAKLWATREARARVMALDERSMIIDRRIDARLAGGPRRVIVAFVFARPLASRARHDRAVRRRDSDVAATTSSTTAKWSSRRSGSAPHSVTSIGSRFSFSSGCSSSCTASMPRASSTSPRGGCWR